MLRVRVPRESRWEIQEEKKKKAHKNEIRGNGFLTQPKSLNFILRRLLQIFFICMYVIYYYHEGFGF